MRRSNRKKGKEGVRKRVQGTRRRRRSKKRRGKRRRRCQAEEITGAEAVAAACSLRHILPTCSHGSSDKNRLTS